jgi:hypothetical protein
MSDHAWVLVTQIFQHWVALVSGSAVSLFILIKEKATDKPVRWKTIVSIFVAGFFVSLFFAWQDEYTSAEWRGNEVIRLSALTGAEGEQIKLLQTQLSQKDRPVVLQYVTDPAIMRLLNRQEQELAELKTELPSPKKKALQVSNDLLRFLADREKAEPPFPLPTGAMTTPDDFRQQMTIHEQAYLKWMTETATESQTRFAVPLAEVLQDMKAENIDVGRANGLCTFFNGNTFGIQDCATTIGVLAQKLSH